MLPTWRDVIVQAEINRERTRNAETNHILRASAAEEQFKLSVFLVRFGVWLEMVGCRMQSRYAQRPNLEVSLGTSHDIGYQSC
jgi:hypothetical protein